MAAIFVRRNKIVDTYGNGQSFGEFAVAFCRENNIDVDNFYRDIKKNSSQFIDGMGDGICANRDRKRINIEINVK